MRITTGDLSDPRVVELLQVHLTTARAATALGSAHALDLTGLQAPDITLWTIWDDETLLGVGALKRLSADHGEIKSMHTAQSMRRRGAGRAMLRHIIAAARARGDIAAEPRDRLLGLFPPRACALPQPWLRGVRAVRRLCARPEQCFHDA